MEIRKIDDDKKRFLPLLLLGDEQESMIDRYLESSDMFAMFDRRNAPIAIAVVSKKAHGQYELMNLAVAPCHQRKGHGSRMIEFICARYKDSATELLVGTGENPDTLEFYRKNKFSYAFTRHNFFTDNYDHPIIENGRTLADMLVLRRSLRQ